MERDHEDVAALADRTLSPLWSCDCADDRPACVQSLQFGNANEPPDVGGAAALLDALTPEPNTER